MAGRIRHEDIEAVRERTDIVQVVSGHLQLKKAGRDSLVGLCPFHTEKTPSFSVSPTKQLYYCHGCGEGGTVFTFLEKSEGLSFVETVERLASQAGITLRYEGETTSDRRQVGRRQVLHKAVAEAARLFQRMLLEGREAAEARAYLRQRGISEQSVDRFGIGYSPGYPDFLLKRMTKAYSPEILLEAGLVTKDSVGAIRDRFRGRVMFPIHDLSGNAVGFGGRLLAGPNAPPNAAKYVNSAETPIYHKSNLLYNLHRAKAEITRADRAFLVEGYTDVVAMDQAGIGTSVATCGTALGEEHIRLLARFTEKVILSFDSDEAGARAAERAYQFHQRYPVDLAVLVLPEGQDPADFALAHGPEAGEALASLAGDAVPLVQYMIERALRGRDLSGVEERARAVRAGLAVVAPLEDPVRRQEYARILAGRVGEPEVSVILELDQMLAGNGQDAALHRASRIRITPEDEVESEVLKLILQAPEACGGWAERLGPDLFAKPTHRRAYELISNMRKESPSMPSASSLVASAQERPNGEQLGRALAALAVEPVKSGGELLGDYAERLFLRLEEFALKRRADVIRKQLEKLNPIKAPTDHEALFEELVQLEGARREVRARAEAVGSASS